MTISQRFWFHFRRPPQPDEFNHVFGQKHERTITPLHNLMEINDYIRKSYEALYRSETINDNLELKELLDSISVPNIPEILRTKLEKDITLAELSAAIDNIQARKAPGPDDLPIGLYFKRNFKNKLLTALRVL